MFTALFFFYSFVKTGLANRFVCKCLLMVSAFAIGCLLPDLKIGYPWGADVAFMAFAFMLFGNIIQENIEKLYSNFKSHLTMGVIWSFLLFILMSIGSLTYCLNNPSGGWVQMKIACYGDYGLFALTAVIGTLMLLFLSIFIELLNERGNRWLSFVGQNTLCIFIVHRPIINLFKILFQFVLTSDTLALLISTVGTLMLSSLLCVFINKYLPLLAGK